MAPRNGALPPVVEKEQKATLEWLAACQGRRRVLDEDLERAVVAARQLGVSWRRIGKALGMTAEGARKRFDVDEVEALVAALNSLGHGSVIAGET